MPSERFARALGNGDAPSAFLRHVLVGRSPRARRVLDLIENVGAGRWPALVLGETGTGKEVVAREIHAHNQPPRPFHHHRLLGAGGAADGERAFRPRQRGFHRRRAQQEPG